MACNSGVCNICSVSVGDWSGLSDGIDRSFTDGCVFGLCERLWLTHVTLSSGVGYISCMSPGGRDRGVDGRHLGHSLRVRFRGFALVAIAPIAVIPVTNLNILFKVCPFHIGLWCWSYGRLSHNHTAGSITWTCVVSVGHFGGDSLIPLTPAVCCSES